MTLCAGVRERLPRRPGRRGGWGRSRTPAHRLVLLGPVVLVLVELLAALVLLRVVVLLPVVLVAVVPLVALVLLCVVLLILSCSLQRNCSLRLCWRA